MDANCLDHLVDSILSLNPVMEVAAIDSLRDIAKCIFWNGFQRNDNAKVAVFNVVGANSSFCLFLEVRKGSLLTTLWNTYARCDEEYCAYFDSSILDVSDNKTEHQILWHVCGIDTNCERISYGVVNWNVMRSIQEACCIKLIGVQAFSKMFVHLLISLPAFTLNNFIYAPPMPATYM